MHDQQVQQGYAMTEPMMMMMTLTGGIPQRYHHTKFQPYSPSGYETCSANVRRIPRLGNSSPDPGELKKKWLSIHQALDNFSTEEYVTSSVLGQGVLDSPSLTLVIGTNIF
jgi:hypothetical protein